MTVHKQASRKELDVLTELNKGLISNQQTYKDMVAGLQTEVKEKDATIMVRAHGCLMTCVSARCKLCCQR